MQHDVLVMMRSGKEYRLALTEGQLEELYAHPDIGDRRVHVIGVTDKQPDIIPWSKFFPGSILSPNLRREKALYNRKTRGPRYAAQPAGPIGFYSGDLRGYTKSHI